MLSFKKYCYLNLEINKDKQYKKIYKLKCYSYLAFLLLKDKCNPYGLYLINFEQKKKVLLQIILNYSRSIFYCNIVNKHFPINERMNIYDFDNCITDDYFDEIFEIIKKRDIPYLIKENNLYYLSNSNFIKLNSFNIENFDNHYSYYHTLLRKCIKNKNILNNILYLLNIKINIKYSFTLDKSSFTCNKNCYCDDLEIYLNNEKFQK